MNEKLSPNIQELRRFFEVAERDIEKNLLRVTGRARATRKYLRNKKKEVRRILSELKNNAFSWTKQNIPTFYISGVAAGQANMGISAALGTGALHKETINLLSASLNNRFSDVAGLVGRRVDDVYRAVQVEQAVSTSLGFNTVKQAAKNIREELERRGVTGFIDKAGRRWNMATYADMAARTVSAEATRRGTWNEFVEHGEDLVRVSSHSTECELCSPWEDVVLSITGKTPGYPTVNDAMAAGLFHPNCMHSTSLAASEILKKEEEREKQEGKKRAEEKKVVVVEEVKPPKKPERKASPAPVLQAAWGYVRASTIVEAERNMKLSGLVDRANFSYAGWDLESANAMTKAAYEMRAAFPELQAMEVELVSPGKDRWYARAFRSGKRIEANGYWFGHGKAQTILQSMINDTTSGFHPEGVPRDRLLESVFSHELAHILDFKFRLSEDSRMQKLYHDSMMNMDTPSRYGRKNIWEFVAECWVSATMSHRPKPVAMEAVRLIHDIVKLRRMNP